MEDVELKQPNLTSSLTVEEALIQVLRGALANDTLARGCRESIKALEQKEAQLCILSESCEEKEYVRIIEGLCDELSVHQLKVSNSKKLGEWAGLCARNKGGDAKKVVGCACVVVKKTDDLPTEGIQVVLDHIKHK